MLIGVAGLFDLRLLGFMKRIPIGVDRDFMPWALVGFAMNQAVAKWKSERSGKVEK